MIEAVQGGALNVLNYIGAGWNYICDGVQGCGNWIGGLTMKVFGA